MVFFARVLAISELSAHLATITKIIYLIFLFRSVAIFSSLKMDALVEESDSKLFVLSLFQPID